MPTIKIALGTTSDDKRRILELVLTNLKIKAKVTSFLVESNITDQPLDETTTLTGARNRAIAAKKANEDMEVGIGIEGGLASIENLGYFLVCAAVIVDKDMREFVGISSKLRLPTKVSKKISKGIQFSQAIREFATYQNKNSYGSKIASLLVSRKQAFKEAINCALLNWMLSQELS